ncbi:MAG: hypothetical protein ACRES5_21155 [Pseudomonas sp.]|uniref:hypothetical protein n=1 Tax=Stenotrophomonas sp. TaxID=69392 RepID=UPI003D6D19C4
MTSPTESDSLSSLLTDFEGFSKEGAIVLAKIDGERMKERFTVMITHGRMEGGFFRKDGDNLLELLQEARSAYLDPSERMNRPESEMPIPTSKRRALHFIWFLITFLSLLGLTTLVIASFLPAQVSPGQLGYAVGRHGLWLLMASAIIVWLASSRDWLPGPGRNSSHARPPTPRRS